jgi:tripartite-type tricarboxylate transporter receptor subunit TctC
VTGPRRLKKLPDVPSLAEADFKGLEGLDPYTYYGLVGPAGLPPAIVQKLNDAINQVSKMPDVVGHMQQRLFTDPAVSTPASFRKYIEDDIGKWRAVGKVVRLEGVK